MRLSLFFSLFTTLLVVVLAGRPFPPKAIGANDYDIMAAVLEDQIKASPTEGKIYAFVEYWPGNSVATLCNDGSQYVLYLNARVLYLRNPIANCTSTRIIVGMFLSKDTGEFKSTAFDLLAAQNDYYKKGLRAKHRARNWTPKKSMELGDEILAMGFVRQDKSLDDLVQLLDYKSTH